MPAKNPAAEKLRAHVRAYYGRVLQKSEDLATNACCASGAPPPWIARALQNVHADVRARFYGCGFPIAEALEGATVLDLGCGSGRDVYIASQLVGPAGFVHGVDMTEAQLQTARATLPWHMRRFGFGRANVAFHRGYIEELEALPLKAESVDCIISNCVVNLSPQKRRVLAGAFRLLKPGGEFYFSDVLCDRRLPAAVAQDPLLHAECLGGAPYRADFLALARAAGFTCPRSVSRAPITIQNAELRRRTGAAQFHSETLRLFKLAGLTPRREDYGQSATYRGGIPGAETRFALDEHHLFEAGRPQRVCGNTAAMLAETRFGAWFRVEGTRARHLGEFPCGATPAQPGRAAAAPSAAAAACC